MATNFRISSGSDFDDCFDLYVQGTHPSNLNMRTSDGTDLALRYAPIAYGSKRADVNYRNSAGTDISNFFAQKGSASYGGTPVNFTSAADALRANRGKPVSATAGISINSDGSITALYDSNSIVGDSKWLSTVTGGAGASYECYITQTYMDGGTGGVGGAALNTWLSLSSNQIRSITSTTKAYQSLSRVWQGNVSIRRASDQVVVCTGTIQLTADADGT